MLMLMANGTATPATQLLYPPGLPAELLAELPQRRQDAVRMSSMS